MRRLRAAAAFAVVAAALGGCGPERRGEPVAPPVSLVSPEAQAGELVFMRYCHECHPGGAAGLGPPINNVPVGPTLIRFQVRNGLGAMPAFGPEQINDEELGRLLAFLIELRRAEWPE